MRVHWRIEAIDGNLEHAESIPRGPIVSRIPARVIKPDAYVKFFFDKDHVLSCLDRTEHACKVKGRGRYLAVLIGDRIL